MGLGRWLYLTLHLKEPRKLTILSGYRVCNQNPMISSRTCYNQQLQLLMAAGHLNQDPCKQFFTDLIPLIQQWHAQDHEVIICLDANKDTNKWNPIEDIGLLLSKTNLVDLHSYQHPMLQTQKPTSTDPLPLISSLDPHRWHRP